MKITRRQLRNLIRESIEREKLVRDIANELANRAADLGILDDIHDSGNSANEIFYKLPEELVLNLPDGDDGSQLATKIARGHYDSVLRELAYEEPEDRLGLGDEESSSTPIVDLASADMPEPWGSTKYVSPHEKE